MVKRPFDNNYQIDGKPLLAADNGVDVSYSDLESDSGRDESGVMHRCVLRYDIKVWTFAYSFLTVEEYDYLQSLFRRKEHFEFLYKDTDGVPHVVNAYCNKSSVSFFSRRYNLYKNLKFDIIEC